MSASTVPPVWPVLLRPQQLLMVGSFGTKATPPRPSISASSTPSILVISADILTVSVPLGTETI